MLKLKTVVAALAIATVTTVVAQERRTTTAELQKMAAQFAPTDIAADVSSLMPAERRVLARLVEASRIVDGLFLRQVWSGNDAMLLNLAGDDTADGRARLHYFLINKGPWDRLDHNKAFIGGAPEKPAGADYYPEGAAKADLERWMQSLPAAERTRATGFFSVIRRDAKGAFTIVPYSTAYQNEVTRMAALLRAAANDAAEPTLKAFLTKRAAAFLSDDYYDSDVAWMELKGAIEPTIGPYEVYEDDYFNYKAAFESFINVRDAAGTANVQRFSAELQGIEDRLPIDPPLRNPKIAALAPIVVVNEIFAAGDANRGVQTAAYNLPNDERVLAEKGAKRVMLKNVQDAKFAKTLIPISKIVLAPSEQANVSFDAFFDQIMVHEMMHGLGPHNLTLNGRKTTVREEMKEQSSYLEEAKADISSLYALQHMIDKGVLPKSLERSLYTTYLVSCFRSIRFGVAEAHGRGIAVQLNYLLDQGGFVQKADGTFVVDAAKIKEGVIGLTHDIMTIQGEGSYAKAKALADRLGTVRPAIQKVLDRLTTVPVDIEPKFTTAERLVADAK